MQGLEKMQRRREHNAIASRELWSSCLVRTEHAFSGLPNNIKQINYFTRSLSSKTIVLNEISVAERLPVEKQPSLLYL